MKKKNQKEGRKKGGKAGRKENGMDSFTMLLNLQCEIGAILLIFFVNRLQIIDEDFTLSKIK